METDGLGGRLRLAVVLLVTGLSLGYALWGLELHVVGAALGTLRPGYVALALGTTTLAFFARVVRFQVLLGEARPAFGRQVVVCGIAFLAINVVPLRLGELVRSFLLLEDDIPWGRSLGAVVIERVVDLVSLLVMLSLVSFAVELPAAVLVRGIDVLAAGQRAIGGALGVLGLGLVAVVLGGAFVDGLLARVPHIGPRLADFGASFREALVELGRRPASGVAVFGLAFVVWASTVATAWSLLLAFPGLPASPEVALAVTAVTVVGMVALPTPGFFGPFEVFCQATLLLWAVDPSVATTFALLWHLIAFGFHVVTGTPLLFREGLSLGGVVRSSRAITPEDG